jgi:two-component system, cell cycle response regulator DivK
MSENTRKKILIVDDEPDVRAFLETLFGDNDYDTCTASDGDEGFHLLQSERPDLVTLDIQMPNETGTRFYRRLTKDDDLKDIPVIVVSGVAGRHLAVGKPAAVFDKPIDKQKLIEAVNEILD